MQKDGTLGINRAKDDYLLQPLQDKKLIMINIPLPRDEGRYGFFLVINAEYMVAVFK